MYNAYLLTQQSKSHALDFHHASDSSKTFPLSFNCYTFSSAKPSSFLLCNFLATLRIEAIKVNYDGVHHECNHSGVGFILCDHRGHIINARFCQKKVLPSKNGRAPVSLQWSSHGYREL